MAPGYQERFKADISNTLAQLTIITVQRSDSGRYRFTLTSSKVFAISDEVELKVQSKYYWWLIQFLIVREHLLILLKMFLAISIPANIIQTFASFNFHFEL